MCVEIANILVFELGLSLGGISIKIVKPIETHLILNMRWNNIYHICIIYGLLLKIKKNCVVLIVRRNYTARINLCSIMQSIGLDIYN